MKRQTPKCNFLFGFDRTLVAMTGINEQEAIEKANKRYSDKNIKRLHNYPNLHNKFN